LLHYATNICLIHAGVNASDGVFLGYAEQHVEESKVIIYVVARIGNSKTSGCKFAISLMLLPEEVPAESNDNNE
jgi:hypothetical protein